MFKSFIFKKSNEAYPTMNARLMSALIDIGLASLAILPLIAIAYYFIYPGSGPISLFSSNVLNTMSAEKQVNYKDIANIDHRVFSAWCIEQGSQLILLCLAIFIFWIKTNSTPGKMLMSMRIVDADTLSSPTIMQYIIRLLVISVSLGLGLFWIPFNSKGRALHDYAAGTLVVYHKKLSSLQRV